MLLRGSPDKPMSEERRLIRDSYKRPLEVVQPSRDKPILSKNKLKKLRRNGNKKFDPNPDKFAKCTCGNPKVNCTLFWDYVINYYIILRGGVWY